MAKFQVQKTAEVDPAILRDINTQDKPYVIVRTRESDGQEQAWSFHTTLSAANAAKRRWISREVVTR